jgi:hypothetical protein
LNLLEQENNIEQNLPNNVVMSEKIYHKGALFRAISSGGTLPTNGIFGIKFICKDKDFVWIQVITKGIDNPVRYNSFIRPKIIVEKKKKEEKSAERDGLNNE